MTLEEKLAQVPQNPGCYIYKDSNNKVIYVGKAKNLKKRVMQYFAQNVNHSPRIEQMITKIHDIEYHIVDTELEALVLEANLIKKYRPKYNVLMKDDKSYTWIKITTQEEYPRIMRIRDQDKRNDKNLYFGPYPDSSSVNNILRVLRKIFPFRTCDYDIKENEPEKKSRLCLYYHIGLCPGPCDHLIEKAVYRKQIQNIVKFLRGENKAIIDEYRRQMETYAQNLEFEKAAILRDTVQDMLYITQKISIGTGVDEKVLQKQRNYRIESGLAELFEKTGATNNNNFRMECYDISNIQGTNPVGAMVVFENGIAKKSDYRKFKIRSLDTPNDFAMMREMLQRRFTHLKDETKDASFHATPDLIIIDGGKGQLSVAYETMLSFGQSIPIVGLAKREELIFFPNNAIPLRLKRDSNALYLVQRIRDEAHRFGITFHRSLRSKKALSSPLDSIEGIGPKTKEKLLKKYKTFENIQKASDTDLLSVVNKSVLAKIRAVAA
jgi:excinuclease ABC subunit C